MKKTIFALSLGALVQFTACKTTTQSYRFSEITSITQTSLRSGTTISVAPIQAILIKDVNTNKKISFKTTLPIIVDGKTVIPANSKAIGTIVRIESKGLNTADIVTFRFESVTAIDGQEIVLKTQEIPLKVNLHDINSQFISSNTSFHAVVAYDNMIKL